MKCCTGIDEKCQIDIFIQNSIFNNMKFSNTAGYGVNTDIENPKIAISLVVFAKDKTYLKSDSRRNVKQIENKIEELFGLKKPIVGFQDIESELVSLGNDNYYRRCELVYLVSKDFFRSNICFI